MINSIPQPLKEALEDLNSWLATKSLQLDLSIIGAVALFLHALQPRATLDIDTLTDLSDEVVNKIAQIGRSRGLSERWLNDQAADIFLPDGYHQRTTELDLLSNIRVRIPSLSDLIALKAAAYVTRGAEDPKDYADLVLLRPSKDQIDAAIVFIRKTRTPPDQKYFPDFEEILESLYALVQ